MISPFKIVIFRIKKLKLLRELRAKGWDRRSDNEIGNHGHQTPSDIVVV